METDIRTARAAEKRPVYTPVLAQVVLEGGWARVTDKDKDRITLSFPPFSDLLIILICPVQVHGEQSF
jgi:hypothetical protein